MIKKIIYTLLTGAFVFSMVSCMGIDNFDAPDAHVTGNIIDISHTPARNIIIGNDGDIRIWERSFTGRPDVVPQGIRIRQGGTYNNERLFAGTYDMLPINLPIWTPDTVFRVPIGRNTVTQNFEVHSLLHVVDFTAELSSMADSIILRARLHAPATEREIRFNGERVIASIPPLQRVRAFVSLHNVFYGSGSPMDIGEYDNARYWANFPGGTDWWSIATDGRTSNTTHQVAAAARPNVSVENGWFTIKLDIPERQRGQTFYVTMGARAFGGPTGSATASINDGQRYNIAEGIRIFVPR
ncbi:MAG: DUF3823 domain-containing protein [Dysgonamonadaceae bacterium]|jgi:hypothetical protein|nr:DUF3823 domain-containing protein [Dysgonamonadaceae bacterium]